MKWQPIETAPKDQCAFLINAPDVECGMTMACYMRLGCLGRHTGCRYKNHRRKNDHAVLFLLTDRFPLSISQIMVLE